MSYMMSKHGDLGDAVGPWMSHLMFYAPKADGAKNGASWGADLRASPVVLDTSHRVVSRKSFCEDPPAFDECSRTDDVLAEIEHAMKLT
jgi:hypothetical protein